MRIHDISPIISEKTGVFPGDVSFSRKVALSFEQGQNLRLSSIATTLHLGAHADGPNHYSKNGVSIAERDLALYMGPALVIHADAKRGRRIGREHLSGKWRDANAWPERVSGPNPVSRVLVSTGSFPDPDQWNSDFNSFEPELIQDWAKGGVRLIGIDTPSIDPEDSKDLPAHAMVAKYDLAVLEGLVLRHVPEGIYNLIALPLRIAGADASPVRAILVEGEFLRL
jgi:arylformamidase